MAAGDGKAQAQFMGRMFDRPYRAHRWHRAMADIEGTIPAGTFTELSRQVVCTNWMGDHRVSEDRERAMLDHEDFRDEPDGEEWAAQRSEYFRHMICQPATAAMPLQRSAYREDFNDPNRIPGGRISGHDQLVHVGSVTAMLWWLASAETTNHRYVAGSFKRDFDMSLPERVIGEANGWDRFVQRTERLCRELADAGEDRVRDFAAFLVRFLGDTQPPWWACFSQEVNGLIRSGDWASLCRALGLGHLEAGERLLLWRYAVREAAPLYRPTVVEANDNPYHFASPPTSPVGIAMPLDPLSRRALREVVHAPLGDDQARLFCSGNIVELEESPISNHNISLPELRKRQRDRLRGTFRDQGDSLWLDRAGQMPWP